MFCKWRAVLQGKRCARRRRGDRHVRCSGVGDRGEAMAKYGKKAQKSVESAMRRRKKGTLRSGSGKKVTSRKQAVAIGLSEAREKGAKVPARKGAKKK